MGYTGGKPERGKGKGGNGREDRRGRTGIQDEEGRRKQEGIQNGNARKVDRTGKLAPSYPTKNPKRETEKEDPKQKTQAKTPEKENVCLFSCLSLNYLGSCSFFVSSF